MKEEIWKDIKDYEGMYQVSNMGKVKSLERTVIRKDGIALFVKEKILKHADNGCGYLHIALCANNNQKTCKIHKLVLETFVVNVNNKRTINHKNGIKHDNRLDNLEYMTHKENVQHAIRIGLISNEKNKNFRKKVLMLTLDNKPLLMFDSQAKAGEMTGINYRRISACCTNKEKTAGGYKWEFAK